MPSRGGRSAGTACGPARSRGSGHARTWQQVDLYITGGQGMQLQMNQTDVCIRCLVQNSLSFRLKHRICAIRRAPPLHSCARRAGLIAACCRLRAFLRPHKLEHHAAVAAVGWPVAHLRHKEGCELFRSHEPGLAGNAGVPL